VSALATNGHVLDKSKTNPLELDGVWAVPAPVTCNSACAPGDDVVACWSSSLDLSLVDASCPAAARQRARRRCDSRHAGTAFLCSVTRQVLIGWAL